MPLNSTARVKDNLERVLGQLPAGVGLVAVSKFQPVEALEEAYAAGQRRFGESRADELAAKAEVMPADVKWHFIGHLQTNKVRRVVACRPMIESIDSERLLRLVNDEALRAGTVIDVLLQVHVAAEETKTGFLPHELLDCARACAALPGIRIRGVMGMATNTDSADRIRADFQSIAAVAAQLRVFLPDATLLSMGMSGDWPIAVEQGANLVRIGSAIFGGR